MLQRAALPPLSYKDTIPHPPLLFDGADICISNTFIGCQVLLGYKLGALSMSNAVITYITLFPAEMQIA